jgi:hypothetical protein
VSLEQCPACGFDAGDWTDAAAIAAIEHLPGQWKTAIAGLTVRDLLHRPIDQMWSIAEYTDHVREVLFGMRFLLAAALSQPGTDLGPAPATEFTSEARTVDSEAALDGMEHEAGTLGRELSELSADRWSLAVMFDGATVDPHWIARHGVHDGTHHLLDVARLRRHLHE